MRVRRGAIATALLLPLVLVGACGGDPQEEYCEVVKEHQGALGEAVASGEPMALLDALDVLRDLQDHAPADIDDEWQQVVGRLQALQDALDDAGVDAASYDRDDPPPDLGPAEVSAIEGAARDLVSDETALAFEGLQQQARDVCKTSLSL